MPARNAASDAAKLAFTCIHERDHLPPLDPQADLLFNFGRYLETKPGPKNYAEIARFYRISASHSHYKANTNLQILLSTGLIDTTDAADEAVDLAEQLIAQGVPGGYYDMAQYLESGYGVKQDNAKALAYFRKAADLGHPDAQFFVGNKLYPVADTNDIFIQFWRCAAAQGHGEAGNLLGVNLKDDPASRAEALHVWQKAAAGGNAQSALLMSIAFSDQSMRLEVPNVGVEPDAERFRRYGVIHDFINRYDGRNPKVPDIDKIVPLPPAPLPAWDGTFEWEKEFKSAKAPEMPSEVLIKKLAQAKGLDPLTGLPLAKGK